MSKLYITVLAFCFIFLSICVDGQISSGGLPESFTTKTLTGHFQEVIIPKPNVEELIKEDLLNDKMSLPLRFAKLLPVNLNLDNSGTWEYQKNGSSIWRLKLRSEDAISVSLYYNDFYLPEGVELFLYDESNQQLKGAYTCTNNKENGLFATSMVYGESIVIELNIPENISSKPTLQIMQLAYAYRELTLDGNSKGMEGSDFCEVNVNCSPEGDNWQQEKRGVVRIKIRIGNNNYWCTGSLINNARNDMTPYVLTADHCAFKFGNYATPDELSQWIFRFKYESPTCDGTTGPVGNEIVGATKVAHGGEQGTTGSDFYLLLLSVDIPWAYEPYFNGWTIDEMPSPNGATIHHPSGDIKKISTYTETLTTTDVFNSGLPSHWEVYWSETFNNWGVTEGGSSGSPLFDPGGRIIGTLVGALMLGILRNGLTIVNVSSFFQQIIIGSVIIIAKYLH